MKTLLVNKLLAAAPLIILATAGTATAGDVRPLARMNLDVGGDDLVTVIYSNGNSSDIKAGQLVTVSVGALYQPAGANYPLEGTLGYKFDRADATNGSAEFTRIPVDIIASYTVGANRFGAGITYHLNPRLKCAISGVCSGNVTFANAFGFIIQYAYDIKLASGAIFDFGARYTNIDYKTSAGETISGSAPGVFSGFAF